MKAFEPYYALPCIIFNKFRDWLVSYGGMGDIRVLAGGVVAPDDDILHIRYLDIESLRDLAKGPVVVQPCQTGDVLLWDGWGKLLQDQGIGVCRVSHNQDLFKRKNKFT